MSNYKELVTEFKRNKERKSGLERVTTNGEIQYDYLNKEFVVFDETHCFEVGRTTYPLCALSLLSVYAKEYLL